jgi:hypothetical protein
MASINSTGTNVSNTYTNTTANTATTGSTNTATDQMRADAMAQMGQLKSAESKADSKAAAAQIDFDDARKAIDKNSADLKEVQTRFDTARNALGPLIRSWGAGSDTGKNAQKAYDEANAELQKLKAAQPALDKAYADAKAVLKQANADAADAKAQVDANQIIINATNPNSGSSGNAATDTNNVNQQSISAFQTITGQKTRDASYWTTANIRTILVEVLSTATDLGNQKLLALAQEVDNNNQQLKRLGEAAANLQKTQTAFGPDDKGNVPVRDGANISLSGKGSTPSGDIKAISEEVTKLFADPNYTPKTLTATGGGAKETEFMNNYLATVKAGLQSGAISKSEQSKYVEMNVTKDQLTALGTTGIKAKQDELSNMNSKLQTQVQQYNNTIQTLTNLLSQFLANFKSIDTTIIQNTR